MSELAFTPCDKCGMRAYVHVTIDTGLPLSFCAHDYATNEEALIAYTTHKVDMRDLLDA